jgi:hypothetical protein
MESGIWLMLMRRQQPTHSHTASFLQGPIKHAVPPLKTNKTPK